MSHSGCLNFRKDLVLMGRLQTQSGHGLNEENVPAHIQSLGL
jgi:hypothetical protein